jgi:hypothetical protein
MSWLSKSIYKRFLPALMLLLCGSPGGLWAQDGTQGGMDFLSIAPNTRALSLGDVHSGIINGAASLFTNPAAMAWEEKSSVEGSYALWISDSRLSYAGAQFEPTQSPNQAWGVALFSSNVQDLQARTRPGPSMGSFDVSYLALAGGYAWKWKSISIGATAMYLNEDYLSNRASGWAVNLGLLTSFLDERVRVGGGLFNVGRMEPLVTERSSVPASIRGGVQADLVQFSVPNQPDWPILISVLADLRVPFENTNTDSFSDWTLTDPETSAGLEIDVAQLIYLRTGYKFGDFNRHFHAGGGVRWQDLSFDYAVIPFTTGYGTAHSLGITYYFN